MFWPACAAILFYTAVAPTGAEAQTHAVPPQNSMKLSQLIAKVEQRDHFQYVSEIEWSEDGYYDITYYTSDKAKVEIKVDPISGLPK
jgi:hypothetical protein